MKDSNNIMKNIEYFGERYCKKYLDNWNKERLENNWWEALKFFFSRSFLRGRRDSLSNEYCCFAIKVLEDYFDITNGNLKESYKRLREQKDHFDKECILKFKKDKNIGRGNSVKHKDFKKEVVEKNPIVKLLITPNEIEIKWGYKTYSKNLFLGNDEDIMMVLDVLKFISDNERKNIYNYLKNNLNLTDKIGNSKVKFVYDELTSIRAISDKIATLTVRDIMLMNSEIKLADKDYKLAFPVDTWVIKIAHKLGCSSENIEEIKNYFIKKCKESDVEPLKVAAGLWFLGFNSLDILLEYCLGDIEIGSSASPNGG